MEQLDFKEQWGIQIKEYKMRYMTLYKRDSSGGIREWSMEVNGSDYRSISCIAGGKENISLWHEAFPKNEGKANATTSEEQAVLECEAKYKKKLKTGFIEAVELVDKITYIKAMKAVNYRDRIGRIPFEEGVWMQPKLNGIRCVATKDNLFTYGGEIIKSCDHIRKALQPAFDVLPDSIFDGELYNHDYRDDLPTLSGLVRLQNPDMLERDHIESILEYHMFDTLDIKDPFRSRWGLVSDLCSIMSPVIDPQYVKSVHTQFTHHQSELDIFFDRWVGEGYEGQIIRLDEPYQRGKRSNFLIKRKEFMDAEFPVVSIEEGLGNWAGCAKRVTIMLPNGLTCGAGIRGTQKQMKYLLQQARNGKLPEEVTVRYLKETPDGRLDIPVVTNIHWKKRRH